MKKYFAKLLPTNSEIEVGNPDRVKLFLCSRDIQVGDKVRNEVMFDFDVPIKDNLTLELAKQTDHFKVIGPISPQAL